MEESVKPAEKPVVKAGKATDNGHLPLGTVEAILEKAPSDLREEIVDVPEWGCSVKIKTLTAAERSRIRQYGIRQLDSDVSWGEMEVQQFLAAVSEPEFTEHQARKLHQNSWAGFQRVIAAHDELSNMAKEELAEVRQEFRET